MDEQRGATMLRGVPFEPEQIIGVLKHHPHIYDAELGLMQNEKGHKLLVAYVVLRDEGTASVSELRAFSRARLYPQLVPDFFIIQAEIPSCGSGDSSPDAPLIVPVNTSLKAQGFQEARDATDILLLDIWSDLLEKIVGIDDDFFAEGGHSLLAVDLLSRIEKQTGQRLPLSTLLTKSTVRTLADTLVQNIAPTVAGEIIELHHGRGKKPLFFLHGDYTGGGFFSRAVAQHADLDGPFLVIQPYGLGRGSSLELPDSVESIAALHLLAIRQKQPNGPYRLAGVCNGGVIAFEIAQQLVQAGETIEFLAVIDPPATHELPVRKITPTLGFSLHAQSEGSTPVTEEEHRSRLNRYYFQLIAKYAAHNYHGRLTLISITQNQDNRDPILGWMRVAKNNFISRLDTQTPCHLSAIQHNAGTVGKILRSAIAPLDGQ